MRPAQALALADSACSQSRNTRHPARVRSRVVSLSLSALA